MNIALYIRLSKEDMAHSDDDSKSIVSQRMYLNDYIKRFDYQKVYEYVDDGYTGTNFNRPAFKKMLRDIENKEINTIITKDSSRLGRNISWVTFYIEEYFPSKKIRYIAIDDNYDSATIDSLEVEMLTFKSLFNDYYCRDISKKIKSSLKIKKIEGKFTGWKAPYGYVRSCDDYHQLEIDEKVSHVVKEIFDLAYHNYAPSLIANHLNDCQIASPAVYAHLGDSKWTTKTIRDILQNPTYIGNMAQGKRKKINYKIKKSISVPNDEWIIKKNTHEAIIEEKVFEVVQTNLEKNHNIRSDKRKNDDFINLMYCRECNTRIGLNYKKKKSYCVCNNYKKNYNKQKCTPHTVNYDRVRKLIISELDADIIEFITSERGSDIRALIDQKRILETKIQNYFLEDGDDLQEFNRDYERLSATLKKIKEYLNRQKKLQNLLHNPQFYLQMIDKIYLSESGEIELYLNYCHH